MATISYFACRGQDIDKLINKSPYELAILKTMAEQEKQDLFDVISLAVENGYLKAKVEISKAKQSSI